MKHNEKYHLWLGHYDSMEEYDKYIDIDGTTQTSQLAIDLGFHIGIKSWMKCTG